MSSDHANCASSPRGSGGGLCKALKEMKSKVATHTGMSLSFVELVATSPVAGLLPALPPSPRSPSGLLHRRMHLHGNYPFVARRSSSTEQGTCGDTEKMGRQNTCNVEFEATQSSCPTAAVDEDTGTQSKQSSVPSMPSELSYGCRGSYENPSSCNLACAHRLSSSCPCNLTCGQPSSSSSCVLLCQDSLLALTHPSSYSFTHNSSSSSACNSSCGHSSLSSSYDLSHGHTYSSSSSDLSHGHPLASSSSSLSSSSSSSLSCDLSGHSSSSANVPAKLVSDICTSATNKLSSNDADRCDTFSISSTSICQAAISISRATSQIPLTSARVLYFIVRLIFAVSSISKSFYKSCLRVSRCVVYLDRLLQYIRAIISGVPIKTKRSGLSSVEDDGHSNKIEGLKVDASVGQQRAQLLKTSCMKRSKLLKSKLRSSFKSLSVQVPRKAFAAPLHFSTFPLSSSSSPSSSSSTSSSPLPFNSPVVNDSPNERKPRSLKSSTFVHKLAKSFNQRQLSAVSQISPVLPGSRMQGSSTSHTVRSQPSSCELKQHDPNSATSLNRLGDSIMVPLVAIPLALCALFYGKLVSFVAVTAWLVVVTVATSVCNLWRKCSQICSLRSQ